MKKNKIVRPSNLEKRRTMATNALPAVRKLVSMFDLASIQSAVKALYDERKAGKELKEAEAKVAALKNKLGK